MKAEIDTKNLPDGYAEWRNKIENLIEKAKLNVAIHVNTDMLSLYWSIGSDIIRKKKELGRYKRHYRRGGEDGGDCLSRHQRFVRPLRRSS